MLKKLLCVKNFLRIVLLSIIIFSSLKSCAKAVDPAFTLVDTGYTESNKTPLDVYEYLFDTFNLVENNNNIYNKQTTWQDVKDNFITATCKVFFINGSEKRLIWGNNISTQNNAIPTTRNLYLTSGYRMTLQSSNDLCYYTTQNNFSCKVGNTNGTPLYYLYCDQYSHWWEYSSDSSIGIGQISALDWEYSSGYQTTSLQGFNSTFYGYNTSYTVNYWNLGKLSGYENFKEVQINLYQIFSPVNQVLIMNEHFKNENGIFTSDQSNIVLSSNGKVSVRSGLLSYVPYYMIIYVYDDNNIVQDSVERLFYI